MMLMRESQVLWVPALVPEPLQGLQVQKRPLPGARADHAVYDALCLRWHTAVPHDKCRSGRWFWRVPCTRTHKHPDRRS